MLHVITIICVIAVANIHLSHASRKSPEYNVINRHKNNKKTYNSKNVYNLTFKDNINKVIAISNIGKGSYIVANVPNKQSSPGLLVKVFALLALIIQNSLLTVSMRLSRTNKQTSTMYISSTAVVVSELTKLLTSIILYVIEDGFRSTPREMYVDIFGDPTDLYHASVPSTLYVLQNNLQFVATSNLPAEVYQVLAQMKLITTAIFAKFLMGKTLSISQWSSILSLFIGIATVQLSFSNVSGSSRHFNPIIGISSVLCSCLTSGYAGIYYERTLKSKMKSIWLRNIQMCAMSVVIGSVAALKDWSKITDGGVFQGYNLLVLQVIGLQAFGGLLTSIVVKTTSSVAKGFATSASIILSCILSSLFIQDMKLNIQFLVGAAIVCIATIYYSLLANSANKVRTKQS